LAYIASYLLSGDLKTGLKIIVSSISKVQGEKIDHQIGCSIIFVGMNIEVSFVFILNTILSSC
jgi:hypothetical protein